MIKPEPALNIPEIIKTDLNQTIITLYKLKDIQDKIRITLPKDINFADYTSNIAFIIAKDLKTNPKTLAENLAKNFKSQIITKTEAVNGYLNFWLNHNTYLKTLKLGIKNKLFRQQNKTVVCEFGQPNTHKAVHIGHLYSYIFGSALSNLIEVCGIKVKRVNYQGDIGPHIAKCLYGVINNIKEYNRLLKQPKTEKVITERGLFLQNCYSNANKLYEENPNIRNEINELNKKIYDNYNEIKAIYETTRNWSLEYINILEKKLNINFDKYYFESQTHAKGKEIVKKNITTIFEEDAGAVIFKGEKYGLHTRVFINRYGLPTYEAKDLGLIYMKVKDFNPDLIIITTAKEQTEYFKVVFKTAELIFPKLKNKLVHIGFGMVNLKTGKMSSRLNNIISAFDVINETEKIIKQKYDTENRTTKILANSAIKFSFLNSESEKDVFFDLEKSISKEGKSGPYLLYSLVRAKSILKKANIIDSKIIDNLDNNYNKLTNEEKLFIRKLFLYFEVLKNAFESYSVHQLTQYLFETAQQFNQNYQKISVINTNDLEQKKARLGLTLIYKNILESGLNILGIETVEKL